VVWDGLDAFGNKAPPAAYKANVTLKTKAGEVHFPFFDVERNLNGLKLTRVNGNYAPDDTLYWDDTPISIVGTPSNPIKNLNGISSQINGHKWGTPASSPVDDQDFGNNKSIDTWSYTSSAPIVNSLAFQLQQADLAVDTITSAAGCAGEPVTYTIVVKNNGPNDVTGAKFRFNFSVEITDISVSSVATAAASSISGGAVSATAYNVDMNIANGAIRIFTINGKIVKSATGPINVSASILRPADVTDPDATNPDAAPPTDPADECNAQPSGTGCNNIKTNVTAYKPAPDAGPDQTIFQYQTATLKSKEPGTWKELSSDPAAATITSPASESTTVTGLNALGAYHFVYTNENGCTDTLAIAVIAANITIPNIFTPNNDGKNDAFKITGLESFPGSQLIIFNRWGNEVYRADNYLNNWDGSGLAEGTYYYVLNRKERAGGTTAFKGWVFLKRSK
jgi:gliding motility-associated-like protein